MTTKQAIGAVLFHVLVSGTTAAMIVFLLGCELS